MKKIVLVIVCLIGSVLLKAQPTNIDFENGNLNGWTFEESQNIDSYFMTNSSYSLSSQYALMMQGVLETKSIPIPMNSPLGGKFMRIGNTLMGGKSYKLHQNFTVDPSSSALSICYAIVMNYDTHYCNDKPYFDVVLKDNLGNVIPSSHSYYTDDYTSSCINGDTTFLTSSTNFQYTDYKNWITKSFSLQNYIGTTISVEFVASGCTKPQDQHACYAYVDAKLCTNSFSANVLSINSSNYNLLNTENTILVCGTNTASVIAPNGASSYSWSGSGINGLTTQSVAITQTGNYQLIFNNPSACSNTTSVSFTIGANPTITTIGSASVICESSVLTMTATGAKKYIWSPYYNNPSGNNTNFFNKNTVYPSSSTNYTVFGVSSNGCSSSTQYSANVLPLPILSVTGNTTICLGQTTTLTASGANTYTWSNGSNSNSIVLTPTISMSYTLSGTNSVNGCSNSIIVNVIVSDALTINSLSNKICVGDSMIYTAVGSPSYTWSNGANTNTVSLKPIITTTYTVSSLTSCGLKQVAFTLTVNPLPNISIIGASTVCAGNTLTLTANGASGYSWNPPTQIGISSITHIRHYYSSTVITLSSQDINGCKNSTSITITVMPSPTLSISSPTVLCSGQSTTLTASGAYSYNWGVGLNNPSIVVSPTVNTSYQVIGTDMNGCKNSVYSDLYVYGSGPTFSFSPATYTICEGSQLQISLFNPYYLFTTSQPSMHLSPYSLTIQPTPSITTVYTVQANNGCGTVTSTVEVTPLLKPILTLVSADSICSGTFYNYSVSGANLYYLIGTGGAYSAVNTFTATAPIYSPSANQIFVGINGKLSNGCISSIGKYIKIMPSPTVSINGNNIITCANCNTSLTVNGAQTYTWSNGAAASSIMVSSSASTNYSVVGTDPNGCVNSAKTSVYIFDSLTLCFIPTYSLVGSNLLAIVAADLNGDNKTDIVASSSTGIFVYMNNGLGNFLSPTHFGSGATTNCLAIEDINNDNAPDIIVPVSTGFPDIISVYINDGIGNFIGPNNYNQTGGSGPAPTLIRQVTVSDLTGDGYAEIITGNAVGLAVYINSGTGYFSGRTYYPMNGYVASVSSKDMNNDNKLDLVTTFNYNDTIIVQINNGTGGFLPYQKHLSGKGKGTICDVNADGFQDIVTATISQKLSVLINNGAGSFSPPNYYSIDSSPEKISSSDFNNDGYPDIAINYYNTQPLSNNISRYVQILMNNGNGTFHFPVNYYQNSVNDFYGYGKLLTKDLNSDSKPDIALICPTKDSIIILLNTTVPSLTITPQTNTVVCAGTPVSLTASGANIYSWTNNILNGVSFTPTQTESYSVKGTSNYGCTAFATVTISISPNLSITVPNPIICSGTSTSIFANGANTYLWSTSASTSSINIMPTSTTTYSVTGFDLTGCSNTKTISIAIDNTCQDVWPGDANSDGTADNLDVLELGLHYTLTGTPRPTTSNLWQSYYAANWSGTITNGKNVNHSNCNGDAIINDNDTLAIFNNYNLIHSFKPSAITTSAQISMVPDQALVAKGTWGTSSIYLGDASTAINIINGVAFTVNYDNSLLETDSVWIEYPTSFINASNQNLKFRKRDFTNGKLYTATTHTISGNVSGYGKIATLHYKIKSALTTDNILNLSISQANQSNASGAISPLTSGSATLMAIGASVGLNEITNGNYISLHPNPTNGALTINSTTELQKIEVMAITGQLLISEVPSSTNHVLHLDYLANGVYFVNMYQNNCIVKREKIILNK